MWSTVAVAGLFAATSAVASEDAKQSVSKIMKRTTISDLAAIIPNAFLTIFDALFGRAFFHWRFILPSIVTSVICVFFVSFIYLTLVNQTYFVWWELMPSEHRLRIIGWLIVGNLIPDYISLIETRILLRHLDRKPTLLRLILFLIFDVIATLLIFTICFATLAGYLKFSVQDGLALSEWWRALVGMIEIYQILIDDPYPVFPSALTFDIPIQIWTTFFTSIWLWLFSFSLVVIRILNLCTGRI